MCQESLPSAEPDVAGETKSETKADTDAPPLACDDKRKRSICEFLVQALQICFSDDFEEKIDNATGTNEFRVHVDLEEDDLRGMMMYLILKTGLLSAINPLLPKDMTDLDNPVPDDEKIENFLASHTASDELLLIMAACSAYAELHFSFHYEDSGLIPDKKIRQKCSELRIPCPGEYGDVSLKL